MADRQGRARGHGRPFETGSLDIARATPIATGAIVQQVSSQPGANVQVHVVVRVKARFAVPAAAIEKTGGFP